MFNQNVIQLKRWRNKVLWHSESYKKVFNDFVFLLKMCINKQGGDAGEGINKNSNCTLAHIVRAPKGVKNTKKKENRRKMNRKKTQIKSRATQFYCGNF